MKNKYEFNFDEALRVYSIYAHAILRQFPTQSLKAILYAFWSFEVEFFIPPTESFKSIRRMAKKGPLRPPPPNLADMIKEIPEELK